MRKRWWERMRKLAASANLAQMEKRSSRKEKIRSMPSLLFRKNEARGIPALLLLLVLLRNLEQRAAQLGRTSRLSPRVKMAKTYPKALHCSSARELLAMRAKARPRRLCRRSVDLERAARPAPLPRKQEEGQALLALLLPRRPAQPLRLGPNRERRRRKRNALSAIADRNVRRGTEEMCRMRERKRWSALSSLQLVDRILDAVDVFLDSFVWSTFASPHIISRYVH
ncbi:hypothetical protein IE81DRAFT_258745 [Ceraceosorus guamensis]|uniref:Uncharacterized protein n=1 Tax=Ceraceosorus guamensis TaxID=1522189 RepID=A0A316VR88_9BASI|nr:hypothetical protein IE81DRAFT_258745 [Ceraceosorus guamensis]PWN39734.1 hypothetical protein IE81DRAFT_258745 [Ceraceosorus guamensis]